MTPRDNLRAVLAQADNFDRQEGATAYRRYHNLMANFANYYGTALNNTVAAFVSLSPNNSWFNNLRSLASVLDGIGRGLQKDEIVVSTYNTCRDRAYDYATGERDFMSNTKGPKVRAFYRNIMDPCDFKPVCIDGHMTAMWLGKRLTMVEAARERVKYNVVARDVQMVAVEHAMLPNQLQATLWFAWKRIHNIVYDGQLQFWPRDSIMYRPEDVKPFTKRAETPVLMQASEPYRQLTLTTQ
jgi:hypothetical protein